MKKAIFLLLALPMLFVACGGSEDSNTSDVTDSDIQTAVAEVKVITIKGDDNMKFDLSEITVKAGEPVKIILEHVGEMSIDAMGHNFVLLNRGVDMAEFATEAISAKDNDYIPAGREGDVIAHTTTIGGGETTEVEFTAPEAGVYTFLCSFPGHSALMNGRFIVE
ncbi:MAG TPA: plastocyanin/azurin family copper-binding protein [Chitinophagales bacterium]|nr:plastocyanin/azurin family copper-binding protein [Chitinophagales bacterium]